MNGSIWEGLVEFGSALDGNGVHVPSLKIRADTADE